MERSLSVLNQNSPFKIEDFLKYLQFWRFWLPKMSELLFRPIWKNKICNFAPFWEAKMFQDYKKGQFMFGSLYTIHYLEWYSPYKPYGIWYSTLTPWRYLYSTHQKYVQDKIRSLFQCDGQICLIHVRTSTKDFSSKKCLRKYFKVRDASSSAAFWKWYAHFLTVSTEPMNLLREYHVWKPWTFLRETEFF